MSSATLIKNSSASRAYTEGWASSFKCIAMPQITKSRDISESAIKHEVFDAFNEANEDDWDGYGASKLTIPTVMVALDFAASIPVSFPKPEVAAESDGEICFDWARTQNRILSISINSDCELSYAGIFGDNRVRGTEAFRGPIPDSVLSLIRRVFTNE